MAVLTIDCSQLSPFIKKVFFAGPRLELSPLLAEMAEEFKVSDEVVMVKSDGSIFTSEDPEIILHYRKLATWYNLINAKLQDYPRGVIEMACARFIPLCYNGFKLVDKITTDKKKIEFEMFEHCIVDENLTRKHFVLKGFVTLRTERIDPDKADEPLKQIVAIIHDQQIQVNALIPLRTLPDAKTQELLYSGEDAKLYYVESDLSLI